MTNFDEEKTPRSQYLNDSTLKQIVVADLLMLSLLSIPKGGVNIKEAQYVGLLIASLLTLYRVTRCIQVIRKTPGIRQDRAGLTSAIWLLLVGSGVIALIALDHSIPALWRLG